MQRAAIKCLAAVKQTVQNFQTEQENSSSLHYEEMSQ